MGKRGKLIFSMLFLLINFKYSYGVTYTSYASWYDANPSGDECFVSIYVLQDNTDISLYRVSTEDTTINTLIGSWTGVSAGTPIHPVSMDASGTGGYGQSFFKLVASNSLSNVNLVNWELENADFNTYPDSHTFVVSTNGTMLGNEFYTYLFHDNNNPSDNSEGMSLSVINPGTSTISVTVERWNGTTWISAPSTYTGGNTANIPPDKIWMYGGVTNLTSGDYRVRITGGDALLYKGNIFTADYDNYFTLAASNDGSKIGKVLYGVMGGPNWGPDGRGSMAITGVNGSASYSIYYYTYSGDPKFPANLTGAWNLWTTDSVNANQSKIYAFGKDGLPDPSSGRPLFVKVVVDSGGDIQVETGQNMLAGKSGDGDFLVAADTKRALGNLFYPTNAINASDLGLSGGDVPNEIVVIAPYAGTTVQVSSPGIATQSWTSTGNEQAHSFDTIINPADTAKNRIYTVTSDKPIYCFYETRGSSANEMEKMYSAVAPLPGPDLQIEKSVNKLHAEPGETITYTITYKNIGMDDSTSTVIWDTLPLGSSLIYDSAASYVIQAGIPGTSPRVWNVGSVPADGNEYTITVAVKLDDTTEGTHIYYNTASINCIENTEVRQTDPVLTISVNRQQYSYWKSYGVWEDKPPSGTQNEGYIHIYGLRDNTTVRLLYSSSTDSSTSPMTIDTMESGFPTTINAGEVIDVGPFNTKFYKIEATYPVLWEFDSINYADKSGHSMAPYSTDYKLCDNKVFYTYLDYYHKTGCGTPDCPDTVRVGDVISIINTSLSNRAKVALYRSLDNGNTWEYLGIIEIDPESIYLYGGTDQNSAGDYMIVSVGDATTNGGENIIVYKGSNIGIDSYWNSATNNQGMMYAISEKGQKADNSRLYGVCSTSQGTIVVNALSGNPSYNIYKYNSNSGATASWPISGNSGTWQLIGGGGPLSVGGAPGVHTVSEKGFYKIEVSGGYVQAAMGGKILHTWAQGDGDYVGSVDNYSLIGFTYNTNYPNLDIGTDFYIGTDGGNGLIEVIMPESGTNVQITGSIQGGLGSINNSNPPTSTTNDQAWRFFTNATNSTFHIQSDKNIIVQFQDQDSDNIAKAFAGSPLFIQEMLTPTSTSTLTPTTTPTVTFTITPTNIQTNTMTITSTETITLTNTETATNTLTYTFTLTLTGTPTLTNTLTVTLTQTSTMTNTNTETVTYTSTSTNTFTNTLTVTHTLTFTITLTPTDTYTGTPPPTDTPTNTYTFTLTPTETDTPTFTFTFTFTNTPTNTYTETNTFTHTNTPSYTYTYTDTYTSTLTPTHTYTGTQPPTFTPTETYTDTFTYTETNTFTHTNTPTYTYTYTDTYTSTFTPTHTFTGTSTSTFTLTNTYTDTFTYTLTSTLTNTYTSTDTPTITYTYTNTHTPTNTYSSTYTYTPTDTPTITPTLPPFPYTLRINIYNSAGEVVKELVYTRTTKLIGNIKLISNMKNIETNNISTDDTLIIYFDNLETPDSLGKGFAEFRWSIDTDGGQKVGGGSYYIKIEQKDKYGHTNVFTKMLNVVKIEKYVELKIYNSAGEIVRIIKEYKNTIPDKISLNKISDTILINKNEVILKYGDSDDDYIMWDGKNDMGKKVLNGIYELKILTKSSDGKINIATKTFVVINNDGGKKIENIVIKPNPFYLSKNKNIKFIWEPSNEISGNIIIYIYNVAGELIKKLYSRVDTNSVVWDCKIKNTTISAGVYICVFEFDEANEKMEIKKEKFFVLK